MLSQATHSFAWLSERCCCLLSFWSSGLACRHNNSRFIYTGIQLPHMKAPTSVLFPFTHACKHAAMPQPMQLCKMPTPASSRQSCANIARLTVWERSFVRSSGDLGTVVSCRSLCGLKVCSTTQQQS